MKKSGKNFGGQSEKIHLGAFPMDSLEYFRSLKKPSDLDEDEDKLMSHTFNETIKYLEETGFSFDELTKMKLHFFEMAGYDSEKGLEYKNEYYRLSSGLSMKEFDKQS